MQFVCVVCSKPADVYCHNDNAYLCAACDVVVHSAHALAASHHRTPVHTHIPSANVANGSSADALSHSILAAEDPQLDKELEPSFDADDWFAVPDVVTCDAKEVQSGALRGKSNEDKLGLRKKEDSFDIDFNCVPWDISLESDPLDLPFEFPLDVPSIDSDLVPSVPASPQLELHAEGPVDQEVKSKSSAVVKREETTSEAEEFMLSSCDGNNADMQDGIPEIFDAFNGGGDIDLNLDIPAPSVQESVKIVPAHVPVPLHAQSWILTYVPHTLLPVDPVTRAASLADRRERVARFRAKKNSFHFKKTIRYASRKRYAEKRPRIKGRFARKDEIEAAIKAGVPLVA